MKLPLFEQRAFNRAGQAHHHGIAPPAWVTSLALIFVTWESVTLTGVVSSSQLPPLHSVLLALLELGAAPSFLARVGQSFLNVTAGILLSTSVVIPLALLVGSRKQFDQAITPIIMLVGALPDLAMLTLLVSVVGQGNVVAIAIAAFSAFFPTYFTIRQGVKEIPGDYFHVASVFKTGKAQTFTKVVLPSIFPNMLTGLRLSFEFSWNVLLAVEIIASVAGIGSFISIALGPGHSITFGLAAIMMVGLITIAIDRAIFERLENRVKRWRE